MKVIMAAILLSSFAAGASAARPVNQSRSGVAIRGYDAVSYFTDSRPEKGSAKYFAEWMGAKWHFSSESHRDTFVADPGRYAPQFGGYCAYAASENYIYDADPEVWRIVDGKLYLNYNREAKRRWEASLYDRIRKAEKNWPALHE